ncbi:YhgE/Pip domain-containing protein [Litoribacterium kuwaitense]|uniref:YhgE/Pip domain-containing protein n=1 Tax=Litoribacterium kuwaitense TaxID=1398745 RepID=UPI001FE51503|nr:YhgE/Pip domain-containing protein [Litoribacterium kuwaitense]
MDPYANTENIQVAITSEDQGTEIAGETVNIGDELVETLKDNQELGWVFVSKEEARHGVERGTYYGSLFIPANFSEKITGIVDGELERPQVEYTVNEKINAITPKITNSGVTAITQQINENFTEAVSETVLSRLKELGIELENQLPTIRKIEQGIFTLEDKLPEINEASQSILTLEEKLPTFHEKALKVVELEERLPEVNQAADSLLKIQEHWPTVMEVADWVPKIQDNLPLLEDGAVRLTEIDQQLTSASDVLATALDRSDQALDVIGTALDILPQVQDLAVSGEKLTEEFTNFIDTSEEALQSISPTIKQNLSLVESIASSAADISDRLQSVDRSILPTAKELRTLEDRLNTAERIVATTDAILTRINDFLPVPLLNPVLERLDSLQTKIGRLSSLSGGVAKVIESGKVPSNDQLKSFEDTADHISNEIDAILGSYDSDIVPAVEDGLDRLRNVSGTAEERLQDAQQRLPDVEQLLLDTKDSLETGQDYLKEFQTELPELQSKVNDLSTELNTHMDDIKDIVQRSADFVDNDLPQIEDKLNQAVAFVENDLPRLEDDLRRLSDLIETKWPELEDRVKEAADVVRNDLPRLEEGITLAADKLRELEDQSGVLDDLNEIIRGDIEEESAFLASPVEVNEQRLYPIPNYGSAMAPFYIALTLWVGGTLLISLLRADPEEPEEGTFKPYHLFLGRLGTFVTIGVGQALFVTLGHLYLLDAYVAEPFWFVLFAVLTSITFVTMTYTLLSVFGNIGKGLAIIMLVFQFTSSGGTFPVSMSSPFFQALNPFVPFTYAISLFRESVGGILWETVYRDIAMLLVFIVLSLILALLLKKPLSGITQKSAREAKKTKVIN